jgi:hypothetical protein
MTPVEVDIAATPNSNGENIIIEAGADDTLLAISSQPAELSNLEFSNAVTNNGMAAQNAVTNQSAISQVGLTAVGKAVQMVSSLTPMQARSAQEVLTGSQVASGIAVQKSIITPIPPLPPFPLPSPIYANVPVYLKFNNELGLDNLTAVIVNGIPDPIPAGTVYADAPVFLSYDNEDGSDNITAVKERP